jgi:uroporphyrinogen III methyltransferase/synthase
MAVEEMAKRQNDDGAALSGKRIVVTRARLQASELVRRLGEFGAEVIEFPTITIEPPRDYAPMDRAIEQLEEYDWLFFTSVNGVEHFFTRLRRLGKNSEAVEKLKVGAIGPETARRLEQEGVHAGFVPAKYQAEGMLEGLKSAEICGTRILIPRAAKAREILPDTLRQWGASVDVVEAYETVLPQSNPTDLGALLQQKQIDMITFTSSSTVSHFLRLFEGDDRVRLLQGVIIACIGPITSQTVVESGLRADIISTEFTIPGLVNAIVKYYQPAGASAAQTESSRD